MTDLNQSAAHIIKSRVVPRDNKGDCSHIKWNIIGAFTFATQTLCIAPPLSICRTWLYCTLLLLRQIYFWCTFTQALSVQLLLTTGYRLNPIYASTQRAEGTWWRATVSKYRSGAYGCTWRLTHYSALGICLDKRITHPCWNKSGHVCVSLRQ